MAGSYDSSSSFYVFGEPPTVCHSGCTNLHSYQQQCTLFCTSSPAFIICRLLMVDILTCVRWYLIVVLICISVIIINVEHVSMCLLAIFMSLDKCLFSLSLLPIFWWFFFSGLNCVSSLYLLDIDLLLVISFADIFSHSVGCLSMLLIPYPFLFFLTKRK